MLKNTMFSITALSTMALLLCITLAFPVFASPAISSNEKSSFEEYTNSDLYSRAEPIQQINPFPFQSRRGPSNPNYTLDVHYDKDQHVMKGSMKVEVTNNLSTTLDHIYFNVWPNAETFQENGGGITVENVQVNGNASEYRVEKTKLDIQQVQWKPHEKKTITMEFKVQIPKQKDRFGWYGDTVSLGNWFPILAVYDEEGWNLDPYYPYGEAFYSLSGNFDVTVTTHSSEVIAATGKQIGERKVEGDMATYRYKAFNVRDFAMEMDPNYHVTTAIVNNVDINVYYTDKQEKYADDMLESGVDSIKLFSEKFGAYPWPELDIVSMEGWFGGMEYPQLVMMSLTDNRNTNGIMG
ncbi:M1 family metallopeptidase [Pontibacillus salicampi]|uniref:M1 family metallopeptidase n=1 Tax=Pontibacillus salicampi TaxID=1449801 RepID=A0ABV6LKZ8_9BACI